MLLTLFLAPRVDLLWLSYREHQVFLDRGAREPMSQGRFYLCALLYYVFLVGGGVGLLLLGGPENYFVRYYLIFLWGSIVFAFMDFLFPSYSRHERLVSERKWTFLQKLA